MRERELADDAAKEGDWVRKKRERGISDGNFGANPDRLIRIQTNPTHPCNDWGLQYSCAFKSNGPDLNTKVKLTREDTNSSAWETKKARTGGFPKQNLVGPPQEILGHGRDQV